MSEWIDVPVADVQTGDEVKVDGIGERGGKAMNLAGIYWNAVTAIEEKEIVLGACEIPNLTGTGYRFRRSSIVSARRRKPEPSPKPGDWRHGPKCAMSKPFQPTIPFGCGDSQVYRASGGWSRDTRDGQPWVMKEFGQASAAPEAYDMVAPVLYGVHDSTGMQQGPGLVPTIYVDTVQYRYLVCAGRAKSIDYVYVDGVQTGSGWAVDHYDRIRPDWRTK